MFNTAIKPPVSLFFLLGIACQLFAQSEKPNVLFIAVDDLRPELSIFGSRAITPNIDRLAEMGLLFNRAYCNQAVCGASRISLLTGLYPEFTGERSFHVTNWRERLPDVVTLNQMFMDNGYATVGVGKIYHKWSGSELDPKHWTDYVEPEGVQYANESTMEMAKQQAEANGKELSRGPLTEAGTSEGAEDRYLDGVRAAEGARLIQELARSDQPYFLGVGFSKPHLPFTSPKQFWDLYNRDDFKMPANSGVPPGYPEYATNPNPEEMRHYSDTPFLGYNEAGEAAVYPLEFPEELNKRLIHGYHAAVSYTDRNVGKLLEALEASGEADNTVIVFWADHGWKLGDHSTWCKHTNFECDTRVPLIVVDPRKPSAHGTTDALVELVDIYPTLAELCGLQGPKILQGKSLVPVLNNPAKSLRDYAYSSYPHKDESIIGHSIRNKRYRYTEWWDSESDNILAAVLTDLNKDPGETTNMLIRKPKLSKRFSKDLKEIVFKARLEPSSCYCK